MKKMSISFNQSHKSSIAHNNRTNTHGNPDIDLNKLHENIIYKAEPIENKYHEIFDEAVKTYNQKQKRVDRKIKDYYEKIRNDSKTHEQRELVVAIGKKEDDPSLIEHKKHILDSYAKEFEQRNPNLAVYNMVMHNDESNPHLHINYVPNFESKRGLSKRVGMDKALQQQGVEGSGTELIKNWRKSETDYIQELAENSIPNFERATIGSHKYMQVAEYKEYAAELERIKAEKKILTKDVAELKIRLSEEREALDEEKDAFEVERSEMDVFLRNKATLEQEKEILRAEREKELEELNRVRQTTNLILTEDEIPNVPFKPIMPPGGGFPTEVSVNHKDFKKMKEQAKKATSAYSMAEYWKTNHDDLEVANQHLEKKVELLAEKNESLEQEKDFWKQRFTSLQQGVAAILENVREKAGQAYSKVFEKGLTEVIADDEISKSPRFLNTDLFADLKKTFTGHFDRKEVDKLVEKSSDSQQPVEKTQEQLRREQYIKRRQQMDRF